jgi:GAF domain-containing protein
MEAVEEGDLDARVEVTSNDEIGVAFAGFNSMIESLNRRDVELRTIYQISQDITASLELEQTLRTVLEQIRQMIPYDGAEIYLYDRETNALRVRACAGYGKVWMDDEGRACLLGEGYAGWIGEQRRSLLVPDVDACQDPRPATRRIADEPAPSADEVSETERSVLSAAEGMVMNSYLGVPLLVGQSLVGTLELASARKWAFDEHTRQLLETIAPQAAIAIENAVQVLERERRLQEEIAQLRIQIDESRLARQVSEITETDYFQELQKRAQRIRGDKSSSSNTG